MENIALQAAGKIASYNEFVRAPFPNHTSSPDLTLQAQLKISDIAKSANKTLDNKEIFFIQLIIMHD